MRATTAFATHAAPWGPLHLAVGDGGVTGLEVLALPDAFIAATTRRVGGPVVSPEEAPPALRELIFRVRLQLDEYFAGRRTSFDLPIALRTRSDWDRQVLDGVRQIPFGGTMSYGRVARAIGRPGAARAVGGAVGRNSIGILVPCHRVIAGDGSLGGYGGDWFGTREQMLAIKRMLLEIEGVRVP